ncbi:tRNA-uridine aminocarboxypropyltransferase [Vibrio viridaestus]|uniref:tRNA-uridine aminocarboxypropyltransferase n=1 Tax=Vibrio viridaestus TaxID=2487322 RepID=A0A3N9TBC7_9VIBR|nr:DTW domain-containing protein [Vibrio viridaestus]RQW61478.1 DTW domain-containing protein [Vibrio viridaestus]
MTVNSACPQCGLKYQCICNAIPEIRSELQLSLLTHEREILRETNTGRFVARSIENADIHIWQRKSIEPALQAHLDNDSLLPFLLYPGEHSITVNQAFNQSRQAEKEPYFILLDSTWQEAQKMLNKTPWLQELPRVQLSPKRESQFTLRRNQKANALCTMEVVAEMLKEVNQKEDADALTHFLSEFTQSLLADKSGHKRKED